MKKLKDFNPNLTRTYQDQGLYYMIILSRSGKKVNIVIFYFYYFTIRIFEFPVIFLTKNGARMCAKDLLRTIGVLEGL